MEKLHHKIKWSKYLFVLDIIENKRIKLQASDSAEVGGLYLNEDLYLNYIKADTVVAALECANPAITVHVKETTPGGEGTDLCLIIKVSYEFLPEINEELLLKRQKLSDYEGLKLYLMQREKEIMDLREELDNLSVNKKSLIKRVEKRVFKDKNEEVIEELVLNEGRYEVTVSLFTLAYSSNPWVSLYFFLDDQNTNKIPNDGWNTYVYNASNPYPYTVKALFEIKGRKNLRLKTWGNDYHSWTATNLIMNAIKLRSAY